jgi:aminomethyltransferase
MSLRSSPLESLHIELGARLVEFGGWNMPLSYPSGTISEHMQCREDAVVFDVSHLGTVRVEGSDAFSQLQTALTNDLEKIGPGRAQYTHLLDDEGFVLDDIIVWWVEEERFDVMPNASNTSNVQKAIEGDDVTATRAVLAIQGPNAREKLEKVSSVAANAAHFGVGEFVFENETCTVAGTGYTGEDGVECALPISVAETFMRALIDADISPAGLGARDTLRLEAGLPLHGHELGPGITPLQANLSWVVGWDKNSFKGKDALLKEKSHGVARRLYGLKTADRRPLREHCDVFVGDQQIGATTSGNISPVLQRGIGLAFLPPRSEFGDEVDVMVRDRRIPAEIVKLPFVTRNIREGV